MSEAAPPGRRRSNGLVDPALLAVAVTWGSSYLVAKEVTPVDAVIPLLVIRFSIASVAILLVHLRRLRHARMEELRLGVVFGLVLSAIFALETFGVVATSAANAGLIISLTLVITPVLQRLTVGDQLPRVFYLCVVLAVLGVALLTQSGGFQLPGLGDLLMLAAALARSVHVVVIARLSRGRSLDSGRVTTVQLMTVTVVFSLASSLGGTSAPALAEGMSARSWLLVTYLAVVCTVGAFFVQMWAVRSTSPSRVSLLLGTEPLWAFVFGTAFSGSSVTALGLVGAALVLVGTDLGRRIERRSREPEVAGTDLVSAPPGVVGPADDAAEP